jgi:hypothetical protein
MPVEDAPGGRRKKKNKEATTRAYACMWARGIPRRAPARPTRARPVSALYRLLAPVAMQLFYHLFFVVTATTPAAVSLFRSFFLFHLLFSPFYFFLRVVVPSTLDDGMEYRSLTILPSLDYMR